MIDFSLTREQAFLIMDALRIYSYTMDVIDADEAREEIDVVYDIINDKVNPEVGAPILQPKGCLT